MHLRKVFKRFLLALQIFNCPLGTSYRYNRGIKQMYLTEMSTIRTLTLHSKMQEHLLQFHYAVRGFQSEAAGFRKSSTHSKLSKSNPHNSKIIPDFHVTQLPFLPLLHYLVKTQPQQHLSASLCNSLPPHSFN